MGKTRVKAGTSNAAAANRRKAFVTAYLGNGRNATQAAITAGYSVKSAAAQASRLLKDVKISAQVTAVTEKAQAIAGLTLERTLQEVARVAYFDPRRLYRDGQLIPLHELDDDTAAAVASLEVLEEFSGRGEERELDGYTKKLKFWDKNAALDKAMRHLGAYEKDNAQRGPDLALQIVLMGPE